MAGETAYEYRTRMMTYGLGLVGYGTVLLCSVVYCRTDDGAER